MRRMNIIAQERSNCPQWNIFTLWLPALSDKFEKHKYLCIQSFQDSFPPRTQLPSVL
jgi:hypothetical protein